jgi:hypothetical protein
MTAGAMLPAMRPASLAKALPLLLLSALLAGCSNGSDDTLDDGSTPTRGPAASTPEPPGRFAILIVDGHLQGDGPPATPPVACTPPAPDGILDFESNRTWARPGSHSFKAAGTWLLVLDRVTIDDPRGGANGCRVRAALQPFDGEALWKPRMDSEPFHLGLTAEDDDLVVGKNRISPENAFRTNVEFVDGDHAFSGDLAFTHAGWWPPSAFEERTEEVPPDDRRAVWWD